MARPPRVPVMLPWECRVIYFLTVCVIPRRDALANDDAWRALCQTLKRLDKWNTHCVLMMPDHIHLLTAPSERELSVAAFLKWLKRWFNELYDFPAECQWQPGGFDRLLRSSESIREKWNYIRENPVAPAGSNTGRSGRIAMGFSTTNKSLGRLWKRQAKN